jgi:hyperosmotically inducible protein
MVNDVSGRSVSGNRTQEKIAMKYPFLGLLLLCCSLSASATGTETEACTDSCLKAAIALQYLQSPFLSPFRIGIRVEDAVVTLDGNVADEGERALAGEIANGLEGVSDVVNRIRVEPAASAQHPGISPVDCLADDASLADRVRTQLYWNRTTHGMAVDVKANDGTVTLRGQAADPHQAELARLITINTCGVKRVESALQTDPES